MRELQPFARALPRVSHRARAEIQSAIVELRPEDLPRLKELMSRLPSHEMEGLTRVLSHMKSGDLRHFHELAFQLPSNTLRELERLSRAIGP